MPDTFAPGQRVTVDVFGGPVEAMVMWRDDSLIYARGHAYRVKVTRGTPRYARERMLLCHESMLMPRSEVCPECDLGLGSHNSNSQRCDHYART